MPSHVLGPTTAQGIIGTLLAVDHEAPFYDLLSEDFHV